MSAPELDPDVSIIMSVYNGAADVPGAIQSIREQTFANFELIAINNGSMKDDTRALLDHLSHTLADPRLRIVHLEQNIGLAGALNHGIGLARGRYIARQDHDDISFPTRFEKQVEFMDTNRECGLLGTASEIWVDDAPSGRYHDHPTVNADLQVFLLSNNPFVHSSIIMRREVVDACGLYSTDPLRQPPEDYEYWSRIARHFEVRNLPQRLVAYREVAGSMSREPSAQFRQNLMSICAENIAYWNGLEKPNADCIAAAALRHAAYDQVPEGASIKNIVQLFSKAIERIGAANPRSDLSKTDAELRSHILHQFVRACPVSPWTKLLLSVARKGKLPVKFQGQLMTWLLD